MSLSATKEIPVDSLKDYDEVPYPGSAFPRTHPSQIAAVARLCGLEPSPPNACRVLELGCAIGANLIPMAESLPGSEFVGIDLSARQIAEGQAILDQLELDNIELRHLNINDIDDRFGKFDYIICHGVYSWVPSEVQDRILEVGNRHLNDNGIMYVSYNTYPGWHLRNAVRKMMRYHVANFETPAQKIKQARELLKFLAESARTRFEAYPKLLEQEAESISERSDSYLFHEFLEAENEPLYFHEFIDRVHAAGLRYVADAEVRTMLAQVFEEDVAALLKNVPMLQREQYMDFLRSRMFRMSLLCPASSQPTYNPPATCLVPLHVSVDSVLKSAAADEGRVTWTHPQGKFTTSSPMTETLSKLNSRWPGWVPIQELLEGPLKEADQERCLRELMVMFLQGIVRFAVDPPYVRREIRDKPECTPFARWQARMGDTITNRTHHDVGCVRLTRVVLEHADGTRTVEELAEVLRQAAHEGQFRVTKDGNPVEDLTPVNWDTVVRQELVRLAGGSLFI